MDISFEKMANALIAGKQDEVTKLTQEDLDQNAAARDILDKSLLAGMDVVGKRFKAGDMFIPEVLLCACCNLYTIDGLSINAIVLWLYDNQISTQKGTSIWERSIVRGMLRNDNSTYLV